jgi:hypothetical protein
MQAAGRTGWHRRKRMSTNSIQPGRFDWPEQVWTGEIVDAKPTKVELYMRQQAGQAVTKAQLGAVVRVGQDEADQFVTGGIMMGLVRVAHTAEMCEQLAPRAARAIQMVEAAHAARALRRMEMGR